MALPEQIAAYDDCFKVFELAQADPKGVRVLFPTENEAVYFRLRMHRARVLQRKESTRLVEKNDPRYNKSEFDHLVCRVHPTAEGDGKYWLYIEPNIQEFLAVESLSDFEPIEAEYTEHKLLEAPDESGNLT